MRKDRRTEKQADMTKIIVAFRNFTKAPKNGNVGSRREMKRVLKQSWEIRQYSKKWRDETFTWPHNSVVFALFDS
jgi:hypothetical protein